MTPETIAQAILRERIAIDKMKTINHYEDGYRDGARITANRLARAIAKTLPFEQREAFLGECGIAA